MAELSILKVLANSFEGRVRRVLVHFAHDTIRDRRRVALQFPNDLLFQKTIPVRCSRKMSTRQPI